MRETKKYERNTPKIKILTKQQLKTLLLFARHDSWYLEIFIRSLLWTKKRGEILGLKFDDFDFDNNIVRIRRQLVCNPVLAEKQDVNKVQVDKYVLVEKPPKKG